MEDQKLSDIGVRTMESDKRSISEEGGGAPKPYMPVASATEGAAPQPQMPTPEIPEPGTPASVSLGGIPKPPIPPSDMGPVEKKNPLPLLIGLIAVLVIGAVAYFFVIPAFSEKKAETNTVTVPEATTSAPTAPSTPSVEPLVPPVEVPTSSAPSEGTTTNAVVATTTAPTGTSTTASSHLSLFTTPADSTQSVVVTSGGTPGALLQQLALSGTQVPLFREVILTDDSGNFVPFATIVSLLAPDVFTSDVAAQFQPDATYYTYTDSNGTWFGLAAQLKSAADLAAAKTAVARFESQQTDVMNFFSGNMTNPSTWKDGSAGNFTGRYETFSEPNAAFNYGWSGRTLLIGTSYNAYKTAANRL